MGQKKSVITDAEGWPQEYNYTSMEVSSNSIDSPINNTSIAPGIEDSTSVGRAGSSPDVAKTWQRRWTLLLYAITSVLLFADQNLLAPNLTAAAEEFGFDDNERDKKLGGDIALAFFILGAPASFIVGCLADSDNYKRSFLFGLIVLIGEVSLVGLANLASSLHFNYSVKYIFHAL